MPVLYLNIKKFKNLKVKQNLEQAIAYYDKAADLFQGEEVCKQKIAQFSAQLEQYQKAIEIYDEIARQSINNNLLKYGVRGHLLNAGICQLCKGDVAITNALERYQELDPAFSGTREYKLLADMAAAMDKEDVAKFTDAVKEFDSMTKLVIITLLWSYITQDRY
ncbi:putative NSF attachment protein [Helianthus debilis subsp. tardiflorus]